MKIEHHFEIEYNHRETHSFAIEVPGSTFAESPSFFVISKKGSKEEAIKSLLADLDRIGYELKESIRIVKDL